MPAGARRMAYRAAVFFQSETASDWSRGFPSSEATLRVMKARGFDPRFGLDIGAYDGQWTLGFRQEFPACRMMMIEGMEGKAERLGGIRDASGGMIDFRIALLGAPWRAGALGGDGLGQLAARGAQRLHARGEATHAHHARRAAWA